MSILFTPFKIGNLEIKNRFVRSATVDNWGRDQKSTDTQVEFYRQMAQGEVGLIISSGLFPSQDGWAAPGQLGIHKDEMISSLSRLVKVVHQNGGKIAAQLMHAGWFGNPQLSGCVNVGPSAIFNPDNNATARELSNSEIYAHIDDFAQAGRRAAEAGFDAVQIHAAHGWFVSAFLSPFTNKRKDEFGGSAQNRAAFLIKTIEGLRKATGPNYPLMIKLGLKDYNPEGKTLEEGLLSAQAAVKAGIDAVEVSEGVETVPFHHIRLEAVKPYYLEECRQARQSIAKPLILVGGMRQLSDIQAVIDSGAADAVSMCRPLIMDQHIVKKLRDGSLKASKCSSCNGCLPLMRQGSLRCIHNQALVNY